LAPLRGDVRRLRGIVEYDGPAVSVEETNNAIARPAEDRLKRSMR
jgi:hypothetical protein